MIVGSVKELKESEQRVGLIPIHAKMYIDNGHSVIVETNLGLESGFSDQAYLDVGAKVVFTAKEVWDQVELMIKVKEPMVSEYPLMRKDQIIFTYLHLAANSGLTKALIDKKVKGVAYETVSNDNDLVLLKPMSEIAGKLAILEANKYLESHYGGKGILLSGATGVDPGHVLIIGAGSVGYSAMREAHNLGASITALVRSKEKKEALLYRFNYDDRVEVLINNDDTLIEGLKKADVIVSSVLIPGAKTQQLVKREHLDYIEKGSVIVDVAIDQGGSIETSRQTVHKDPIYIEKGIIHYCVSNMAGAVPKTASVALGSATVKYGLQIANLGLEEAAAKNIGLAKGVNTYLGDVTNKEVASALGLQYTKIRF